MKDPLSPGCPEPLVVKLSKDIWCCFFVFLLPQSGGRCSPFNDHGAQLFLPKCLEVDIFCNSRRLWGIIDQI